MFWPKNTRTQDFPVSRFPAGRGMITGDEARSGNFLRGAITSTNAKTISYYAANTPWWVYHGGPPRRLDAVSIKSKWISNRSNRKKHKIQFSRNSAERHGIPDNCNPVRKNFFTQFGTFQKFLKGFGSLGTCSNLFWPVRIHLDALRCVWMRSDLFGFFQKLCNSFRHIQIYLFFLLRLWMFFESFLAFSAALYVGASTADVHRRTSSYVGVRRQCHTSTYVVVRWRRSTHVAVCWRTSTYVERVAHLDANVARSFESSTKFIDRIDRRLLW